MKKIIILIVLFSFLFESPIFSQLFNWDKGIITNYFGAIYYSQPVDINGDGYIDIVAKSNENRLVCYLNEGNRRFFLQTIENFDNPNCVSIVDIDNDGDSDIIGLIELHNRTIVIYNNDGRGHFEKQVIETEYHIDYLAIGDLNNDDFQDILFLTDEGDLYIYMNEAPNIYSTKSIRERMMLLHSVAFPKQKSNRYEVCMEISDINNDSLADIIISFDASAYLINNKGNGEFEDGSVIAMGESINSFKIYDCDNDGYNDILIHGESSLRQFIYDNGNYNYSVYVSNSSSIKYYDIVDVDNDGNVDIVYAKDNEFGSYMNYGDLSFGHQNVIDVNESKTVHNIICFDYNNDEYNDFTSFYKYDHQGYYAIYEGYEGVFSPVYIGNNMEETTDFCIGDFDGDNTKDIISTDYIYNNQKGVPGVYLIKNYKDKGYACPKKVSQIKSRHITSGDIDKDGKLDFLTFGQDGGYYSYYFNWHKNNGESSFTKHRIDILFDDDISGYYLIDFDGDGYLDIVGVDWFMYNGLFWLRNNEGDGFGELNVLTTENNRHFNKLLAEDLNVDGLMDFVASDGYGDIYYLRGLDGSSFSEDLVNGDNDILKYHLNDINNDGLNDIVVSAYYDDNLIIGWYENSDDGLFEPLTGVDTLFNAQYYTSRSCFSTDIEVDGDIDLVWEDRDSVRYYYNDGVANFDIVEASTKYRSGDIIQFADLDNDLDPDIIFSIERQSYSSPHDLVWFENKYNTVTERYLGICEGDVINFYGLSISESGNYSKLFTSQNGGDSLLILEVEVFPNTIPSFDIIGPEDVEQYEDINYNISQKDNFLTYYWHATNGEIKDVASQTKATVNWRNPGEGKLELLAVDLRSACYKSTYLNVVIDDFKENDFIIYPNPATTVINMPSISDTVYADFYSLKGELIKTTSKSIIDISDMTKGAYIIKMYNPSGRLLAIKKIILQ